MPVDEVWPGRGRTENVRVPEAACLAAERSFSVSMRTMTSRPSCRGLATLLLACIVLTLVAPPAWAQGTQTQVVGRHRAFVVSARGTVEIRSAGQQNWVAARANMEIRTGDRVRTGPNSSARLKVGDVGEFDVQASTELTVGNLQQVRTTARAFFMFQRQITRDDVAMDLRNGDLRSSFQRQPGRVGNYNVHTPVAVAGVRGTKFELDLEGGRPWYERMGEQGGDGEEMGLLLIVGEGEVGMMGPNWERVVRGGQQLNMRQGQMPGQPGDADPSRLGGILGSFTGGGPGGAGGDTPPVGGGLPPSGDSLPPSFPGDTSLIPLGATGSDTGFLDDEFLSDTEDPFASFGSSFTGSEDTFDTNAELMGRVQELFDAYENMSEADFLEVVDYDFAGVNNSGNALTYATLATSVQSDIALLSSVLFEPTVTSIARLSDGRHKVDVTWNGRFRFATVDTELVRSSMTTTLLFGSERPFFLEGWEGASPFGLTVPSTGVAQAPIEDEDEFIEEIYTDPEEEQIISGLPAPVVTSASGYITNRIIAGRDQEFAPYRVTITGTNFQEGARVQFLHDELAVWLDSEGFEDGTSAIPYVQSSSLIYLDFISDFYQYLPDDDLTEVQYWRVLNPDGQYTEPQAITTTVTPGPLEITGVTTSQPISEYPNASTVLFEIEGYNFVMPLTIDIDAYPIGTPQAQAVGSYFNIVSGPSVMSADDGMPVRLQFEAQQTSSLSPQDHYVNVTDARNQTAYISFPVASSPPPSNITWTTNQVLTSDFTVAQGQSLDISGAITVSSTGGARLIVEGTLTATGTNFQNVSVQVGSTGTATLSSVALDASGLSTDPAAVNNGGTLQFNGATISNAANAGFVANGGTSVLYNVQFSNNQTGVVVQSGTLNLENPAISGGQMGIQVNGGSLSMTSGGSISGTANEGLNIDGGTVTIGSNSFTISNAGSNNVRVGGAATVNLSKLTLTGATTGLLVTSAAGSATVSADFVSISGTSGPAVVLQGGTNGFNGNVQITGGASSAVLVENDADLTTSGTNNSFSSTSAPATFYYASGAGGTITLGTGTSVNGGTKAMQLAGSGSVQLASGVVVSGASSAGVYVEGGASVLIGAATIQNNGGDGVLVGNCTVVDLNGSNVLNNGGFGVARTDPGILNGYVSLDNVQLSGNNGQGGSDLNTSPAVANSTQYNYLTNPPNSVSNPR